MFWRSRDDEAATTPEERMRELLSAYRDGELSASEEAEAVALVERDPAARADLDDLDMLVSALSNLGAEVRAPRSFAIPADAGAPASRAPFPSFQRIEWFFRASAATAALLFAVVLVGSPTGETPVSAPSAATQSSAEESSAAMGEMTSMTADAPAGEAIGPADAASSDDGAAPAPSLVPDPDSPADAAGGAIGGGMPLPGDEPGSDEPETPENAPEETAPFAQPAPAIAPDEARSSGDSLLPSASDSASEPMPGTFLRPASSEGVGGIAAGLGTIAGLLTALSVLMAWHRRKATVDSSSDR